MAVELSILSDGGVMMLMNEPLPDIVKRVEYYREQRLFMLIYHTQNSDSDLMEHEIPEHMTGGLEKSPDVMIYTIFEEHEPLGYKVPLIKVGALY